jgi:DNA-binding NarL/FixJ family response regulator
MDNEGEEKGSRKHRDYVGAAVRRYRLTSRMEKLARLLFDDVPVEDAAQILGRSVGTIKGCSHEIYIRVGAHSRAQFVKRTMEAWFDEHLSSAATDSS